MKIGDLVRYIHTGEVLIITSPEWNGGYYDVYSFLKKKEWHVPKEHLEMINENR